MRIIKYLPVRIKLVVIVRTKYTVIIVFARWKMSVPTRTVMVAASK